MENIPSSSDYSQQKSIKTIDTFQYEIHCKVLITSILDDDWAEVKLKCLKNEIIMYMKKSYFDKTKISHNLSPTSLVSEKKLLTEYSNIESSRIPIFFITTVIKDIDTMMIRLDSKSMNSSSMGYYLFKFDDKEKNNKLNNYGLFLTYLENFEKNITFMNRTKEQDNRF